MEKILTMEDRIKKAEEIYKRRRGNSSNFNVATVNLGEGKNYGLLKKMILQILICLVIYFIFYLIQNSNYIFSEEVLIKTKEVLSYDIDIPSLYEQITKFLQDQTNSFIINPTNEVGNTIENNNVNDNKTDAENENAIGGAEIEDTKIANNNENKDDKTPKNDDDYIKEKFLFIKPIDGIVSSEFGQRDVDNPIVSKNHTGIDIAADTGTKIQAAMEGKVTISSTVGDYGYHIKIENEDVSTLYAHCSKLYVKEGDFVNKGQEIAEVGSTGKSTGPHLHFEIMRGSNYINPRDILDF